MALSLRSAARKIWQTLSSIKTGVVLIILVVIFSAAGTVILQRPDDRSRRHAARLFARTCCASSTRPGLTDVFHARWFVALMILVSLSIIAASVERFPNAWRFFARPYKSPDENFRRALPTQAQIPIPDEETDWRRRARLRKHGIEAGTHRSHRQLLAVLRSAIASPRWRSTSCTPACC